MKLKWFLSSAIFMLSIVLLSACDRDTGEASVSISNNPQNDTKSDPKPDIGTLITELTGLGNSDKGEYRELDWKELAPDQDAEDKIVAKYQPLIDKITEGNEGDAKPIYDKMIAEFNGLPANPKLDGQKIKIAGYVTILEQEKGLVNEFLLVPNLGACIHVPPPPLNNTLLIKPKKNKRIHIDDTYSPVWIKGIIRTKNTITSLAEAGYLIENADVELYDSE